MPGGGQLVKNSNSHEQEPLLDSVACVSEADSDAESDDDDQRRSSNSINNHNPNKFYRRFQEFFHSLWMWIRIYIKMPNAFNQGTISASGERHHGFVNILLAVLGFITATATSYSAGYEGDQKDHDNGQIPDKTHTLWQKFCYKIGYWVVCGLFAVGCGVTGFVYLQAVPIAAYFIPPALGLFAGAAYNIYRAKRKSERAKLMTNKKEPDDSRKKKLAHLAIGVLSFAAVLYPLNFLTPIGGTLILAIIGICAAVNNMFISGRHAAESTAAVLDPTGFHYTRALVNKDETGAVYAPVGKMKKGLIAAGAVLSIAGGLTIGAYTYLAFIDPTAVIHPWLVMHFGVVAAQVIPAVFTLATAITLTMLCTSILAKGIRKGFYGRIHDIVSVAISTVLNKQLVKHLQIDNPTKDPQKRREIIESYFAENPNEARFNAVGIFLFYLSGLGFISLFCELVFGSIFMKCKHTLKDRFDTDVYERYFSDYKNKGWMLIHKNKNYKKLELNMPVIETLIEKNDTDFYRPRLLELKYAILSAIDETKSIQTEGNKNAIKTVLSRFMTQAYNNNQLKFCGVRLRTWTKGLFILTSCIIFFAISMEMLITGKKAMVSLATSQFHLALSDFAIKSFAYLIGALGFASHMDFLLGAAFFCSKSMFTSRLQDENVTDRANQFNKKIDRLQHDINSFCDNVNNPEIMKNDSAIKALCIKAEQFRQRLHWLRLEHGHIYPAGVDGVDMNEANKRQTEINAVEQSLDKGLLVLDKGLLELQEARARMQVNASRWCCPGWLNRQHSTREQGNSAESICLPNADMARRPSDSAPVACL